MPAETMIDGGLWQRTLDVTRRAHATGALEPMATHRVVIHDHEVPFVVHVARLEAKRRARELQRQTGRNPFLPPDPELFVADVSDTHVCVLNRFNVLPNHLIIVTREFEDQSEPLTDADYDALARCMAEFDGLGFYNGGATAGASQAHKHLQLAPLPIGDGPLPTPMDSVFDRLPVDGHPIRCTGLPFEHAVLRLDGRPVTTASAAELAAGCRRLLGAVGAVDPGQPYNLLVTRRWLLAVARRAESVDGISINSLGFAGSLLVRDRNELALVRDRGPMALLAAVVGLCGHPTGRP